jgi:alkylation response protein AidB-like acyl-CoA dehydrogenase
MNFDFDDTQYALRDMTRDLFAKESPASRVRELWDGKPFDRRVWKTMADAGILGITVPEKYGGAGGNEVDLALVLEEAGRAALPEPLLETTGIAARLLAASGDDRWLPAIAAGDAMVAVQERAGASVAWGAEADLIISIRDNEVHLVEAENATVTPITSQDRARPLANVDADFGDDTLIAADHKDLYARAFFGTAALLNGIARQFLERTLAYVKDREQFGRPVGSFQAVKHKLAAMHVAIESARPATWYASYAIAMGAVDQGVAACVAKIAANDAEAFCNTEALQCHGGIGFTWEDDLHLWLKRGIALRSSFGSSAGLRGMLLKVHRLEDLT